MRGWSIGFISLMLFSQAAYANLPPSRPDYLLKQPEKQWFFAERLWRGSSPCTEELCEGGYHDTSFVLSVDRQGDWVKIVAGFEGCESPSWNNVELAQVDQRDRPEYIRKRVLNMISYAAKTCKAAAPKVDVPSMDALFISSTEH
jgi:hypothetical protein